MGSVSCGFRQEDVWRGRGGVSVDEEWQEGTYRSTSSPLSFSILEEVEALSVRWVRLRWIDEASGGVE